MAGLVAGVVGISERASGRVHRRQPAGSLVPLVLSFGERLHVEVLSDGSGAGRSYGSFVAGLSKGHADTWFDASQDSVQLYLTPCALHALLGVPGKELARRTLDAADLIPDVHITCERLHAAPAWPQRFAIVDELLEKILQPEHLPPSWLRGMWAEILHAPDQVKMHELVASTGWSHRYVASQFRQHLGLAPKEMAGLIRFERAMADLGRKSLAAIAGDHGYSDQSHFTRDVVRHAGETPGDLLAARRPTPVTAMSG